MINISFSPLNFVRLRSKLRILGFDNNWVENRCRVVLKRYVNVIGRNACALAWLTKKTEVIERRLLDNLRWNIRLWTKQSVENIKIKEQNLVLWSLQTLRDVIRQIFPFSYHLFRGFYELKPKLVNITN